MGRRKSVRQLEQQLQYARARAAYNPPQRQDGSATRRRPKIAAKYVSLYSGAELTIQVPQSGLQFFGGGTGTAALQAVGLGDPGTDPTAGRGFKPCQIHATVADGSPSVVRARGSNRPYIRYARGSRGGNTQSSFSCAFSSGTAAPTAALLKTRFETLSNANRAELGGAYGRIWATWEQLPVSESGAGGVAAGGA